MRSTSWKSLNYNGQTQILDQLGNTIGTLDSEIIKFSEPLSHILQSELIEETDFERLIDLLGNSFQVNQLNQSIVVITEVNNGLKSETYIDKRYQKEVAIVHYNLQEEVESRRTFLYELTGSHSILIGESLETFKKSLDSERMMTIIELTEYEL